MISNVNDKKVIMSKQGNKKACMFLETLSADFYELKITLDGEDYIPVSANQFLWWTRLKPSPHLFAKALKKCETPSELLIVRN